jgi:D-glycero-D-manno-heptose 1,7-bisphosphate phosphatase
LSTVVPPEPRRLRKVAFTDRDGTLNPDFHYLKEPGRIELLPGVTRGIALLREHGYVVVCVTNQSGIARGLYTHETVRAIHAEIQRRLERGGTRIDAFYYCPHQPSDDCLCRKPKPGMCHQAAAELGLEFAGGAILGDRALDVEVGRELGLVTCHIPERGREASAKAELDARGLVPDIVAESYLGAVARLLYRS